MTNPIHFTTAEEAVKVIKSGDHVHLSSVASAPQCLINAMCKRGEAGELKDVHVHHLHTEGPAPYADPKFEGVFQLDSFFVGANVRKVTQSGYADYIPIFLSETQRLYRCGAVPCNVAMIQVCPPDKHGFVSLGTSVDATLAAVETADYVLAVVNKHVPRAFGQAMIHSSKIDYFVQDDDGAGDLRGKLVDSIQRCLERRDAAYQTRWDKVWSSALCQRYRRPESDDHWLWARAFYDAPVIDLRAIAALVQLPVK